MKNLREFPEQKPRVETGPIRFGNDWPGVFIRGDDCAGYSLALKEMLEKDDLTFSERQTIMCLKQLLDSAIEE